MTLSSAYEAACEATFARMAVEAPDALLAWIDEGDMRPADLTFAAEAAGRIEDSEAVRRSLVRLLDHVDAIVREGAIYGLIGHLNDHVRDKLASVAARDPSPGVRAAAVEALS